MSGALFLQNLAIALSVAALVVFVFRRLNQPVVLGYVVAGMIVGPNIPIPVTADPEVVRSLAELGAVLIMFVVGLEFRLTKLFRQGRALAFIAVFELLFMLWAGFTTGRLLGWSVRVSLFAGAIMTVTSTPLVLKALQEEGIRGRIPEMVVGVSLFEDMLGILLIAVLSAVATAGDVPAGSLVLVFAKLFAFMAGLLTLGFLLIPGLTRHLIRHNHPESMLVAIVGIGFTFTLIAQEFGYSGVLGAFIAGSMVSESGEDERILPLVRPLRDVFAAVFFVSIGMLIDPRLLLEHWKLVALLSAVVIGGKFLSVSVGAFLAGNPVLDALRLGLSFGQIGELTLIVAGIGQATGTTPDYFFPVAVSVVAVSTFTTPWLIRYSADIAAFIDRKLPKPLQTYSSLYASWINEISRREDDREKKSAFRRTATYLVMDALVMGLLIVGAALLHDRSLEIGLRMGIPERFTGFLLPVSVAVLCVPLFAGVIKLTASLAMLLSEQAFPRVPGTGLDRANAPRLALRVTLQIAAVMIVLALLLLITQPFLSPFRSLPVIAIAAAVSAFYLWRSASNLHGHVRAGVMVIAEVLEGQTDQRSSNTVLEHTRELLTGLGTPETLELHRDSPAAGKTLGEVNLRGLTGAAVLAIVRGPERIQMPNATDRLEPGDLLVLSGSKDAIADACRLLGRPKDPGGEEPVASPA